MGKIRVIKIHKHPCRNMHMHSSILTTPPASHTLAHTLAYPHTACQERLWGPHDRYVVAMQIHVMTHGKYSRHTLLQIQAKMSWCSNSMQKNNCKYVKMIWVTSSSLNGKMTWKATHTTCRKTELNWTELVLDYECLQGNICAKCIVNRCIHIFAITCNKTPAFLSV